MSYKKVSIQELPLKIKAMMSMHQNPGIVEIYECSKKEDLYELSSRYPFETTAIANNANSTKTITGYFMVGITVPTSIDDFKRPVLAYYYMNDSDWRAFGEDIKTEVSRRKKLYNETKAGFKSLIKG